MKAEKQSAVTMGAVISSFVASVTSFLFGVFLSPVIVPVLQDGLDYATGCKSEYMEGRRLVDERIIPLIEDRSTSNSEEIHALAKVAYSHFESASSCKTPLGSNALISMSAMHCSGIGFPEIDRRKGQILIFEAGSVPGASAGRIFSATISCRESDMRWFE